MALRTLRQGMTGPDVKAIQQGLNSHAGPSKNRLREDGAFGAITDRVTREFQSAHGGGLIEDGIVGPKTRGALFPLGVATVTLFAHRARKLTADWPRPQPDVPNVGSLRWPPPAGGRSGPSARLMPIGLLSETMLRSLRNEIFQPRPFPPLPVPLPVPVVPDWTSLMAPSVPGTTYKYGGFAYDHNEFQTGWQRLYPLGDKSQDAFVWTMQSIYVRGYTQAILGFQVGKPVTTTGSDPWTFNPFVQLTDADRFAHWGIFHLMQPYSQVGFQVAGRGPLQPTITSSLFPVNVTLSYPDENPIVSLNLGAGITLNLDVQAGRVQFGPQFSIGATTAFP